MYVGCVMQPFLGLNRPELAALSPVDVDPQMGVYFDKSMCNSLKWKLKNLGPYSCSKGGGKEASLAGRRNSFHPAGPA